MLDCERANNLISAKIDGEIAVDEATELEAHLSECAGCRATLAALTEQDAQLHRAFVPHRQASAAIARSAMQRIRREQLQPRGFRWLNVLAAAAAGFALALLIFQPWKHPSRGRIADTNPVNPH